MKDRPPNKALEFIGLMTILGAVLLGGLFFVRVYQRSMLHRNLPSPSTSEPRVIAEGWDTGSDTFLMDVPESCPAQYLEYRGWQKTVDSPASMRFVVSKMNEEITAVGTDDFVEFAEGMVDLALEDETVYALIVRGSNARWRFAVTCR